MSLEQKESIDKIEIVHSNIIQVRYLNIIYSDGAEIARGYRRTSYCPIDDISAADDTVKAIAAVLFTDEAKAKYKADQGLD